MAEIIDRRASAQSDAVSGELITAGGLILPAKAVDEIAKGMAEQKDIYGPGWRSFMGIYDDSSGAREITDQPADYDLARTVESYIYRAVDIRGKSISQVPLRIWETDVDGNKEAVDHPAMELLMAANPLDWVNDEATLARYTLGSLDLHGFCAWKLVFNGRSQPTEVYWLPPTSIQPLHGYDIERPELPFAGVRYITQQGIQYLPPEEIVYFATDNFSDPIMGTSKISVLKESINLRRHAARSNIDFFKNSMRPDWILSGDFTNSEENVERIRRAIRRHLSGENNRMPLILGEQMSAHLLTMAPKDAEWSMQQRLSQEEIAMGFGVPPIYFNNFDRATYDNVRTAKLMLWHDTMIPEADQLAKWLTRKLLWRFWPETRAKKWEFGFDYAAIEGLGEDLALIWERFMAFMRQLDEQTKEGALTPNQMRVALVALADQLGIDPTPWQGDVPGGDTFYMTYQHLPVEQLSVQANIDINAARSTNPQLEEDVPGAPNIAEDAEAPNPDRVTVPPKALEPPELKVLPMRKAVHPIVSRTARLAPIQDRLTKRMKRHFQDQMKESLRNLRGEKDAQPQDTLYDAAAARAAMIESIRKAAGDAAAEAYAAATEDYSLSVDFSLQNNYLDQYMGKRLSLINGIDDTTQALLSDTLLAGSQDGETIVQLADRVTGVFRQAIDYRAEMIARTETIQAYGSASLQSYRDAGVEKAEMYDGDGDETCAARDGQIVTLDEAEAEMDNTHPNCVLGYAPFIEDAEKSISLGPGIRLVS